MAYKNKKDRRSWQRKRYKERINYLQNIKEKNSGCDICGWNNHYEILQFHHKEKDKKEFELSGTNLSNLSITRIQKEIDKCLIICPNCHLWLHYNERDWFKKQAKQSHKDRCTVL